jgi:Domain of unknown function (DUF4411)
LSDWVKNITVPAFFHSTDETDTVMNYSSMVSWIYAQSQFKQEAKDGCAPVPDGWLIAYANPII